MGSWVEHKKSKKSKEQIKHIRHVRVPVFFRDPVEAPKHNRKDLVDVLLNEAENVLIIPEVQSSFCNLPQQ